MGHCIRAVIGTHEAVQTLTDAWVDMEEIKLPQGYGMVLITYAILDDITELYDSDEDCYVNIFDFFTEAMDKLLEQYSFYSKFAYIETDYFGGVGTQAGVLYKNGKVYIEPQKGAGSINRILRELGVWCEHGKDEFDSLKLGLYRQMPIEEDF